MAYFRCSVGSGGNGIPLVVTCASAFAGLTITCSDGTTTLTDTCPSSSPYEITFNLPNTGTWTVSGTISGTTYTESILVNEFDVTLNNNISLVVDFYSAADDTVSYTGLDSQTHTITTDSSGHATATIMIALSGSTITFNSSVAKDPDNLSNDFTKAIALTSATTSVYFMPTNDCIYWYGYKSSNFEPLISANGWTGVQYANIPTTDPNNYQTNAIQQNPPASGQCCAIGTKSPVNFSNYTKVRIIWKPITGISGNYCGFLGVSQTKKPWQSGGLTELYTTVAENYQLDITSRAGDYYISIGAADNTTRVCKTIALWCE